MADPHRVLINWGEKTARCCGQSIWPHRRIDPSVIRCIHAYTFVIYHGRATLLVAHLSIWSQTSSGEAAERSGAITPCQRRRCARGSR